MPSSFTRTYTLKAFADNSKLTFKKKRNALQHAAETLGINPSELIHQGKAETPTHGAIWLQSPHHTTVSFVLCW